MQHSKWDKYFYNIACSAAENSSCLSRKIGAVIVRDNKFVVSTGYNGPPMGFPNPGSMQWFDIISDVVGEGCNSGGSGVGKFQNKEGKILLLTGMDFSLKCPRKLLGYGTGEGTGLCPCAHAERNAIAIAARLGNSTEKCQMYLNCPVPCLDCARSIVNAGIQEVIVPNMLEYEKEGFSGLDILENCGVKVRLYE